MRINLTKKDLVNLIYMQLGFSKKVSENIESSLEKDFINERTKIYPVEHVANAVWHSYTNKRIHNPLGFEGKFSSFFMNLCPSFIRFLSKRMYKDTFLN